MKETLERVRATKDMAREHVKWLIRHSHVQVPRYEELVPILVAAASHREKLDKGKKYT